MNQTQEQALIDLLWNYMKRDPENPGSRRQTAWGTKTRIGLVACIRRIVEENDLPADREVRRGD